MGLSVCEHINEFYSNQQQRRATWSETENNYCIEQWISGKSEKISCEYSGGVGGRGHCSYCTTAAVDWSKRGRSEQNPSLWLCFDQPLTVWGGQSYPVMKSHGKIKTVYKRNSTTSMFNVRFKLLVFPRYAYMDRTSKDRSTKRPSPIVS